MAEATRIELLAPARNADIGIEAIRHGADAVYIGAPRFGARQSAGNPIEDIERLVRYAHLFHARVYVTINTIIREDELADVEKLIHELYAIKVDAILVQDMAVFEMNLPPIAIHASTQMDNRTIEKVRFLHDIGCAQVVLARECSIDDIKAIHADTDVKLEAFVHGALCVSYSGQCYASEALMGRSANRGECAQICRLPFDLQDNEGHSLGIRHWLSLKDMNQSDHIEEMLDAGVVSFKIEGRLKDAEYVKNVTAYYRAKIDKVLLQRSEYTRLSDGESVVAFTPNIEKSFHRGSTSYFFNGRGEEIYSPYTPKSTGELIGTVIRCDSRSITVKSKATLNNGDGFCFYQGNGTFMGFRANRIEGNTIHTSEPVSIKPGTSLYRNLDMEFERMLARQTASRQIGISISLKGNTLTMSDGDNTATIEIGTELQKAQRPQADNIRNTLSKLGDTIYKATDIAIDTDWFFPASVLADHRRRCTALLDQKRLESHPKEKILPQKNCIPFVKDKLTYLANINNSKARAFHTRHGVTEMDNSYELGHQPDATLMFCRHCLRFALGTCHRHPNPNPIRTSVAYNTNSPLFLISGNIYLKVEFDCKNCQMLISKG